MFQKPTVYRCCEAGSDHNERDKAKGNGDREGQRHDNASSGLLVFSLIFMWLLHGTRMTIRGLRFVTAVLHVPVDVQPRIVDMQDTVEGWNFSLNPMATTGVISIMMLNGIWRTEECAGNETEREKGKTGMNEGLDGNSSYEEGEEEDGA
eukprot:PDM60724.1 hypothetical protein PRIPAC_54530 [Pristionchus pacificus]